MSTHWPSVRPFAEPEDLADALAARDLEVSMRFVKEMTGWDILASSLDDDDDILYFAAREGSAIKGYAAYLNETEGLVCIPEQEAPLFVGADEAVIRTLSPTMHENAVRWRRDCLMFARRRRVLALSDITPGWTAFYSEKPLAQLAYPAHFAVLKSEMAVMDAPLVVTDGISTAEIDYPVHALHQLIPLWGLEWVSAPQGIPAMTGRSKLKLLTLGPSAYKVGMLFNELGGLITWSPAASHCDLMSALCKEEDCGFSRHEIYQQLAVWLGPTALLR